MKNCRLFLAIAALCSLQVHGEEDYRILYDTTLYDSDTVQLNTARDEIGSIAEGEMVSFVEYHPLLNNYPTTDYINIIIGRYRYNNKIYIIKANALIPWETDDTFTPSFISELNDENRKTWVPAYYVDVLRSRNRDTVLQVEPWWQEEFDPIAYTVFGEEWYERFAFSFPVDEFDISNSALVVNRSAGFMIKNITAIGNGYRVTVKFVQDTKGTFNYWLRSVISRKDFFDLLLVIDGDYLDMYLDDTEHKLTSFVLVDMHFLTEMKGLIENNTADLSAIKWPRRGHTNIETGKTYTTVENLSLRATESRDSETLATLPAMTAVQVLEKGAEDTIDSIKANWVKVRLGDGTEGWCFGGYLVPIVELPVAAQEAAVTEETPEVAAKPEESAEPETEREISTPAAPQKASLPWFIIGIGVLVLAGGGALFLARKRKGRG